MIKQKIFCAALVFFMVTHTSLHAQLYNYTTNLSGVPASYAANTAGSSLGQVNGALPATGCPTGFNSNKYAVLTTYASNRPAVEFTLTPDVGYQLDITSLSVDARVSVNGPAKWRLAYSLNGGATWIDNGADLSVTNTSCGSVTTLTWDMADFSTDDALKIRVYGYAALNKSTGIATIKNFVLSGSVSFADEDGDGYTFDVDCNDGDANIHPGATEICNTIDDNCSGTVDEDVTTTYYADIDGDTFGDAGNTTEQCSMPGGYVADNTDCDDNNASVNPAATEVCNAVDDDCNGTADDGLTFITYYADADADGFGNNAVSSTTCDGAPAGYIMDNTDCDDAALLYTDNDGDSFGAGAAVACGVYNNSDCDDANYTYTDTDGDGFGTGDAVACGVTNNTDCNDGDNTINPAATEICNTIDDDCDGSTDEGVQTTYYNDADGDAFGNASVSADACTAPEGYILDNTDCNDANAAINPAATEVCNSIDDDCDGSVDEGTVTSVLTPAGTATYCSGSSVTLNVSPCAGCTYTWYKNGLSIVGAISASYIASTAGNFQAQVTIPAGCSQMSAITVVSSITAPNATITAPFGTWICSGAKLKAVNNAAYTYQWNLGGSPIAGATVYYYVPTVAGSYTCTVTNNNGCVKTSTPIVITTCGKEGELPEDNTSMEIYPNPSAGGFNLHVDCSTQESTAFIRVINMVGEDVFTASAAITGSEINERIEPGTALTGGIYFVKVMIGNTEYTKQLVIQH